MIVDFITPHSGKFDMEVVHNKIPIFIEMLIM